MNAAQLSLLPDDEAFPVLWVNIGQICIGKIYDRSGQYLATDDSDRPLGAFSTLKQARAAVWLAHIAGGDIHGVGAVVDRRRAA
jgi:hypothetical protein